MRRSTAACYASCRRARACSCLRRIKFGAQIINITLATRVSMRALDLGLRGDEQVPHRAASTDSLSMAYMALSIEYALMFETGHQKLVQSLPGMNSKINPFPVLPPPIC